MVSSRKTRRASRVNGAGRSKGGEERVRLGRGWSLTMSLEDTVFPWIEQREADARRFSASKGI